MDKPFVKQFVRDTFKLKPVLPPPDKGKADRIVEGLLRKADAVRRRLNG